MVVYFSCKTGGRPGRCDVPRPLLLFNWPTRPHQVCLNRPDILSIQSPEQVAEPGNPDEEFITNIAPHNRHGSASIRTAPIDWIEMYVDVPK
jgi:hypothetical protein